MNDVLTSELAKDIARLCGYFEGFFGTADYTADPPVEFGAACGYLRQLLNNGCGAASIDRATVTDRHWRLIGHFLGVHESSSGQAFRDVATSTLAGTIRVMRSNKVDVPPLALDLLVALERYAAWAETEPSCVAMGVRDNGDHRTHWELHDRDLMLTTDGRRLTDDDVTDWACAGPNENAHCAPPGVWFTLNQDVKIGAYHVLWTRETALNF